MRSSGHVVDFGGDWDYTANCQRVFKTVQSTITLSSRQSELHGGNMRNSMLFATIIAFTISACKPQPVTPPYSIKDPNTQIVWCPECPNLRFHLNTVNFTNDTPLTFDDRLLVYHGVYCTILEKQIVENYTWTDEFTLEETNLSDVDIMLVRCDNRYRRGSDGATEFLEDSYVTEGWIFPNALMTIEEWDKWAETHKE